MKDYFLLASRNLRKRGLRSWLTLLGIFVGVAAVISLISLGNGFKTAVNSQFGISSTEVITVQAGGISGYGPPGMLVTKSLTRSDAEAIEKIDSVKASIPSNVESAKAEFNDKSLFTYAASIPEGEHRKYLYEMMDLETIEGRLLEDGDSNKIVIGNDFSVKEKSGFD